ncbi:MAG: hypothetical protein HUU38_30415 [Anaerolineales bacterium]|nr:hypothetical protein [Anaerolineales bacterium]
MKQTLHPPLSWLLAIVGLLVLIIIFSALSLRIADADITPTPWTPISIPTIHPTTSPTPGWWEALSTAQSLTPEN